MKNILLTSMSLLFILCIAQAQQRDMAEIRADGIQIPVVNHMQVNNPVQGLLVYDINLNSYWYFDGGQWVDIGKSSELIDDDGDTRITVEDFADSDEITFDVKGRSAFEIRETPSVAEILQFRVPDFNHGNLLFGFGSGEQIDTTNGAGFGNTTFGAAAGLGLTTGQFNTFLGHRTGEANTIGIENTMIGAGAGLALDNSSNNVIVGAGAAETASSLQNSTILGHSSGINNNADGVVLIGYLAGENNQKENLVAIGNNAGKENQGDFSTMIGFSAGLNNQADGNTIVGYNAGFDPVASNVISGTDNVFVGTDSGASMTSGFKNTFVGRSSGISNQGGDLNTYLGAEAGQENTVASENTLIGADAGFKNNGNNNTFLGTSAGRNNTMGENNVFIGHNAGIDNMMGSSNIVIGAGAAAGLSSISNELIIQNDSSLSPLIHGDFIDKVVTINDLVKLPKLTAAPTCSASEEGTIFYGDNAGINGLWLCNASMVWTQLDN
jgi:hypothetical protein